LHHNKSREEVINRGIRCLPDLSIFNNREIRLTIEGSDIYLISLFLTIEIRLTIEGSGIYLISIFNNSDQVNNREIMYLPDLSIFNLLGFCANFFELRPSSSYLSIVFWGSRNTLLIVMMIVPNSYELEEGECEEEDNSAAGVNEVEWELGTRGCQRDNPRLSVN